MSSKAFLFSKVLFIKSVVGRWGNFEKFVDAVTGTTFCDVPSFVRITKFWSHKRLMSYAVSYVQYVSLNRSTLKQWVSPILGLARFNWKNFLSSVQRIAFKLVIRHVSCTISLLPIQKTIPIANFGSSKNPLPRDWMIWFTLVDRAHRRRLSHSLVS